MYMEFSTYTHGTTTITNQDFDQLMEEEKSGKTKEWSIIKETQDGLLKVYRKMHPQFFIFKATMILNCKIPHNLSTFPLLNSTLVYLLSCNYEIRSKWDPVYLQVKIVEHLQTLSSEESETVIDIVYTKLSTPPTIANRDSCLLRVSKKQAHSPQYLVLMKTTAHTDCPLSSNVVRASSPFHGYIIEQLNEKQCKLFLYSVHDFGGNIPKAIVNMVSQQAPAKWYHQLQQQIHKVEKQMNHWVLEEHTDKTKKKNRNETEQFLQQHLLPQIKSNM